MISFAKHRSKAPVEVNMTPLVDVIFILLIFFVISSIFVTRGMDVELPQASTSQTVSGKPLELVIKNDGTVFLDGNRTFLTVLHEDLSREFMDQGGERKVLLKVQPDVHIKLFVRIMDMVRRVGFSNLVIATRPEGSGGTEPERG